MSALQLRISGVRSRPTNPDELSRAQTSAVFGDYINFSKVGQREKQKKSLEFKIK